MERLRESPDPFRERSDADRWRTCVHEAGHAIIATAFGVRVLTISADPEGSTWGRCVPLGRLGDARTIEDARAGIVVALAGSVAEEIECGEHLREGALTDNAEALSLARKLVGLLADIADAEVEIKAGKETARALLRSQWPNVQRLAFSLEAPQRVVEELDLAGLLDPELRSICHTLAEIRSGLPLAE